MKVTAILKGKADAAGRKTIYIRISNNQERKFRATQMKIEPEFFKAGKVVGHPTAKLLNERIKSLIVQVEHQILFPTNEITIESPTFADYTMECHRIWDRQLKASTVRQHMGERNKFLQFMPNLRMNEFTPVVLNHYTEHCYELGNTSNTVWKTFKYLKKVIYKAYRDQVITSNPFLQFKVQPYKQKRRDYLDDQEVKKLTDVAFRNDITPEHQFVLRWFLLGCLTGLRFSDWQQFNQKKHIKNDRIILYTTKTGELVTMPLVNETRALFQALKWKPMHLTNQHFNRMMKELMVAYNIDKKVTAHISRHTFGVMCATRGLSIETCARLMGISMRVCQVYYKLQTEVTDREYLKLFM